MTKILQRKINQAAKKYAGFMDVVFGIEWRKNSNTKNTHYRVAKAFIQDLFIGLYSDSPKLTSFPNDDNYTGMVFQGNIQVNSMCAHHHLPFEGIAHIAYIPGSTLIGLSKLNRVVEWFSRRPQIQENLTKQISDFLQKKLKDNKGIAVMIEARHSCCSLRGVKHRSVMKTSVLSGAFLKESETRAEFYDYIKNIHNYE